MRRINAVSRVAAHALIAAFAAFVLLAMGGTGAQAAPNGQVASIGASPFDGRSSGSAANAVPNAAPDPGPATTAATSADAAGHVLTSCIPGRDKVRVECNAVAPTSAQLQHSPSNNGTGVFPPVRAETAAEPLSGRTPAALTHLDLGIVRT